MKICVFLLTLISTVLANADLRANLSKAIQSQQWSEAVQISSEILDKDPTADAVRVQQAYALFQKNFSYSALFSLSKIPSERWKSLPQGPDRMAEIVLLLQKKVPLSVMKSRVDLIREEIAPTYLLNEILYAKGRGAFETMSTGKDNLEAKKYLEKISERSLYYGKAHYLLGALHVKAGDMNAALADFSKVFNPSLYDQSSEAWNELSSQMTTHWGANLNVLLNIEQVKEAAEIEDLANLAIARIYYSQKNYIGALSFYNKLSAASSFYEQAKLESVWTLLAQNKHAEASSLTKTLTSSDASMAAIEAHVLHALTLTESGQALESRKQIETYLKISEKSRIEIDQYKTTKTLKNLPKFLQSRIDRDNRIKQLNSYQAGLQSEIAALIKDNSENMFPSFRKLGTFLESQLDKGNQLLSQIIDEHIKTSLLQLQSLDQQVQIIKIESYLEEREKLRSEYKDISKQKEHDQRLIEILEGATQKTGAFDIDLLYGQNLEQMTLSLEFRQSELLWELGKVRQMKSLDEKNEAGYQAGEQIKKQAVQIVEKIVRSKKEFPKRLNAYFFYGFSLIELGKFNEGLSVLLEYVTQYPKHNYVPDAYRIIADAKFDSNNFSEAENYYKKILEFPNSSIVGYALYKMGWCAYNKKDFSKALLALEKSYTWTRQGPAGSGWLSLQRESQRDLIEIYSEVGNHKKAAQYFESICRIDSACRAYDWLVDLADAYDKRGQYEKSGDLYKNIMAQEPDADVNLKYHALVANGYLQLSLWDQLIQTAEIIVQKYKSRLAEHSKDDRASLIAEEVLRNATMFILFEHKKRSEPVIADRTDRLSRLYLLAFSNWQSAKNIIISYAYFLAGKKNYIEASSLFIDYWQKFSNTLSEKEQEESLRNILSSLSQAEDSLKISANTSADISEFAKKYYAFSQAYAKKFSQSKDARKILFTEAMIHSKYNQLSEAVKIWNDLLEDGLKKSLSDDAEKDSFHNLRFSYYSKKNWSGAYEWSTKLITMPEADKYKNDLQGIREETSFFIAENSKSSDEALLKYESIAADKSLINIRDKSLYNAFIHANKLGQNQKALQIADELQKDYPSNIQIKSIAGIRAALYQEAGDYLKALPLLKVFLDENKNKSDQKNNTSEAIKQAELNLKLITDALGSYKPQKPASAESVSFIQIKNTYADFIKRPIQQNKKDLATKIRLAVEDLEKIVQTNTKFFSSEKSAATEAFEAFCMIPNLYKVLATSVDALSEQKDLTESEKAELLAELKKVSDPLLIKAEELANSCIEKNIEAELSGPIFKQVLNDWFFNKNSNLKLKTEKITKLLQDKSPWLDRINSTIENLDETQVYNLHFQQKGTEDSWLRLARIREKSGSGGLARLTLIDALNRFPKSGKILNEMTILTEYNLSSSYAKAIDWGSQAACANAALFHLKGLRLDKAKSALKKGIELNSFSDSTELNKEVVEFLK